MRREKGRLYGALDVPEAEPFPPRLSLVDTILFAFPFGGIAAKGAKAGVESLEPVLRQIIGRVSKEGNTTSSVANVAEYLVRKGFDVPGLRRLSYMTDQAKKSLLKTAGGGLKNRELWADSESVQGGMGDVLMGMKAGIERAAKMLETEGQYPLMERRAKLFDFYRQERAAGRVTTPRATGLGLRELFDRGDKITIEQLRRIRQGH